MAFDLKDLLEVGKTEAAAYGEWFTRALLSPKYIANQARVWNATDGKSAADSKTRFYSVLVISAFIGATIGAVIPGRPPMHDRATVAVVVVLVWYFIGLLMHVIVRMLGGKGARGITVKVMMQLLALVYVISNVVCLVLTAVMGAIPTLATGVESIGLTEPGTIIVLTQFVCLLVYLPLSIRRAHGFRGVVAGCVIALVGAGFATLLATGLVAQGSC
jgi:hypothetical protein